MLGHSKLSLFTNRITRDRIEFERTRASASGHTVFEMGECAGELPRKFISFYFSENESNEMKGSNTEGTEKILDLPQKRESEIAFFKKTETSPTKSLALLKVAGAKESNVRESEDTNKERVIFGSQECPLSSSD